MLKNIGLLFPLPLIFGSHILIFRLRLYEIDTGQVCSSDAVEGVINILCLNFDNAEIHSCISAFQRFSNLYPFPSSIINSQHVVLTVLYTWLKNYDRWEE